MEKVQSAEDFLQDHLQISHFYDDKTEQMVCYSDDVQKAMTEFAKLHVEAALKAAEYCTEEYDFSVEIKNSYPLENIK